jgi:hypothetical protein
MNIKLDKDSVTHVKFFINDQMGSLIVEQVSHDHAEQKLTAFRM